MASSAFHGSGWLAKRHPFIRHSLNCDLKPLCRFNPVADDDFCGCGRCREYVYPRAIQANVEGRHDNLSTVADRRQWHGEFVVARAKYDPQVSRNYFCAVAKEAELFILCVSPCDASAIVIIKMKQVASARIKQQLKLICGYGVGTQHDSIVRGGAN